MPQAGDERHLLMKIRGGIKETCMSNNFGNQQHSNGHQSEAGNGHQQNRRPGSLLRDYARQLPQVPQQNSPPANNVQLHVPPSYSPMPAPTGQPQRPQQPQQP